MRPLIIGSFPGLIVYKPSCVQIGTAVGSRKKGEVGLQMERWHDDIKLLSEKPPLQPTDSHHFWHTKWCHQRYKKYKFFVDRSRGLFWRGVWKWHVPIEKLQVIHNAVLTSPALARENSLKYDDSLQLEPWEKFDKSFIPYNFVQEGITLSYRCRCVRLICLKLELLRVMFRVAYKFVQTVLLSAISAQGYR